MKNRPRSLFSLTMDMALLTLESQAVVGLRVMKAMVADAGSANEASLMVTEKARAAIDAQQMIASCVISGRADFAPARLVTLYRRKVKANRRRLLKTR